MKDQSLIKRKNEKTKKKIEKLREKNIKLQHHSHFFSDSILLVMSF